MTIAVALVAGVFGKAIGQKLGANGVGTEIGLLAMFLVGGYLLYRQITSPTKLDIPESPPLSADEQASLVAKHGLSELMVACAEGDVERVKVLVAAGHDVNARSNIGTTALMYAAQNDQPACVSILLAAGADASAATKGGSTAQLFAERAGCTEVVRMLRVPQKLR